MKGNQATGLLGLLPEDRANRARLGSERKREGIGSRIKGQDASAGGFMPHCALGLAPKSSIEHGSYHSLH